MISLHCFGYLIAVCIIIIIGLTRFVNPFVDFFLDYSVLQQIETKVSAIDARIIYFSDTLMISEF